MTVDKWFLVVGIFAICLWGGFGIHKLIFPNSPGYHPAPFFFVAIYALMCCGFVKYISNRWL